MRVVVILSLLNAFALAACGGTAQLDLKSSATESLAISADTATDDGDPTTTDAADALIVHVVRTDVHVASADGAGDAPDAAGAHGDAAGDAGGGADAGFTTVSSQPRDLDVKALAGTPGDLAGGEVPAGRLTEIRLVLDETHPADLVVAGASSPVAVPSAAESGLKLVVAPPVELAAGGSATLTVTFDGTVAREGGALTLTPVLSVKAGGANGGAQ